MKIALAVTYLGTHYHGWQMQPKVSSVQATLENALSKIACHPVNIICAGRTDKGVHASHQIVHFETTTVREVTVWIMGTNYYLPRDINVLWAMPVSEDFHARFSAISRAYHYIIYNERIRPTHFLEGLYWVPQTLNEALMQQAAFYLLGTHDFSAFRDKECQAKHPVRTILSIEVVRKHSLIIFHIKANAFLHHMVRNIVGTLLPVGQGMRPIHWVKDVLEGRQRANAGAMAPAQGLYLTEVNYPELFMLPTNVVLPWMLAT